MTDGAVGLGDVMRMSEERPLEPLCGWPDGYQLYEVVYATHSEDPELVRAYRGRDAVPRAIHLIRGGVPSEDAPEDGEHAAMYAHEDPSVAHTRMVLNSSEQAARALEGALESGSFTEVDTDD